MKSDLKVIFMSTAIYIGLIIGGTVLMLVYLFVEEKYPVIDSAIRIFGIVYYLILFGYIFIRWLIKKKKSTE